MTRAAKVAADSIVRDVTATLDLLPTGSEAERADVLAVVVRGLTGELRSRYGRAREETRLAERRVAGWAVRS